MKKLIASSAAALLLAGGLVAASVAPASAHTPAVTATCEAITITATNYEEKPAVGEETIANPDYVPAVPGTPAVGEPTITVDNPDYVPAQDAVTVTEFEWRGIFDNWGTIWGTDRPYIGWWKTGAERVIEISPATPAEGEPTIVIDNPDYVPATPEIPAQGEPVIPNPDYVHGDSLPNLVSATVDGENLLSLMFGTEFQSTITLDPTESHEWSVTITAWNDPDGSKGWTQTYSGTTEPCVVIPEQPETEVVTGEWTTGTYECGDTTVTETRDVTTTVYVLEDGEWVPEATTVTEERTRDLTAEEIEALECSVPPVDEPEEPAVTPEEPTDTAPVAKAAAVTDEGDVLATTGADVNPVLPISAAVMAILGTLALILSRRAARR